MGGCRKSQGTSSRAWGRGCTAEISGQHSVAVAGALPSLRFEPQKAGSTRGLTRYVSELGWAGSRGCSTAGTAVSDDKVEWERKERSGQGGRVWTATIQPVTVGYYALISPFFSAVAAAHYRIPVRNCNEGVDAALDWAAGVVGTLSTRYRSALPVLGSPGADHPHTPLGPDINNSRILGGDLARDESDRAMISLLDNNTSPRLSQLPPSFFVRSALGIINVVRICMAGRSFAQPSAAKLHARRCGEK
jgi:hypothetical protein